MTIKARAVAVYLERNSVGRVRRVDSGGGRGGGVAGVVHEAIVQVVRRWIVE